MSIAILQRVAAWQFSILCYCGAQISISLFDEEIVSGKEFECPACRSKYRVRLVIEKR